MLYNTQIVGFYTFLKGRDKIMLRSLRNFIITLLLSGAVFGTAAYYASGILVECLGPVFGISADTPQQNADENGENNNDSTDPTVVASDTFSMLLINTNYRPSEAGNFNAYDVARYPENEKSVSLSVDSIGSKKIEATDFIIMRGNSAKNEYTYTYLPASLTLTVKGQQVTLNDIYRDLGVTFLVKKISAITGFDIDYYSIYDLEDVSYIVEYISGVSYNVPVDIKGGDNIVLSAGSKTIQGEDVIKLLDYQGYTNTAQRSQMLISLIKNIMSKITNRIYRIDVVALHRSSSSKVDTTVNITAINSLSELLYAYNSGNIVEISYPGNYKTNNGILCFMPNISSAISKFSSYR